MRKGILFLIMFLGFVSLALADVTYEILKTDLDDNGNIRVYTQYKVDGVEVVSNYAPLDGKYYWVTRYDAVNFAEKTEAEMKAVIESQLKQFGESLISKAFIKTENAKLMADTVTKFIGTVGTVESATIKVSETKEWVIEDGQKTVNTIAVSPVVEK